MAELLALGLAAWRLASMLADEDGPFALFARLRHAVGLRPLAVKDGGQWRVTRTATTPLAELFACVWCLSVWTAALLSMRPLRWLQTPLAASALAIAAHELIQAVRKTSIEI